jgi:MFS family permease
MASATAAWVRRRLAASGEAFSATARNPGPLRAQLSFGAAWTAEAAFTVALGVVAFVDGGAEAVGLVAFARMVPAALFTPVGTAFADRFPRDRVLVWSCLTRTAATGAAAAVLLAGGPSVVVYPLAVVSTCAFRRTEPRNLSRLRIAVDALA